MVLMIASLAAVGLAPGLGGSSSSVPPPILDETPEADNPLASKTFPDGPAKVIDAKDGYKAIIKTNEGTITVALSKEATEAVNNFAFLAGKGFYDNTLFFYVNPEFAAQAGDPTCDASGEHSCTGFGDPGYAPLPVEKTGGKHDQWAVVAPAVVEGEAVHPSQFRILLQPDPRLDGQETVFGHVIEGQDVLEQANSFIPCSMAQVDGCQQKLDLASALIIQDVIVEPA